MNRNDVGWQGYWAAVPTPFDAAGEIVWDSVAPVVESFLSSQVHGILVNGSSGEWHAQSDAEREEVARRVVDVVGGRVPVVVGCTALRPATTFALAGAARAAGADGVMVSVQPYVRPSADEAVEFFRATGHHARLPVMVYNIPRRVGVDLDDGTLLRVAALPEVVALKNSTTDDAFFRTLEALVGELRVFGGNLLGERGVEAMRTVGGDGFIGGWELLGPTLPRFFQAVWAGDYAAAALLGAQERALDLELWDAAKRPRFGRSFQSQLKAALNLIGVPAGLPRPPLLPLDDEAALAGLRRVLSEFHLVGAAA